MTATNTITGQAIVQDTYGDDVFRLTQIATPSITDNEVLVRVHAAGMDRGTWHMMTGLPSGVSQFCGRSVAGCDTRFDLVVCDFAVR